jgi:hypothetical protein
MASEWWIGRYLERNDLGLIEKFSRHFAERTEEKYEQPDMAAGVWVDIRPEHL